MYRIWTSIFGAYCLSCHSNIETDKFLCSQCESGLFMVENENTCSHCGRPMLSEIAQCINCRSSVPPYKSAQSIFYYNEQARALLYALKKRGGIFVSLWFTEVLQAFLKANVQYQGLQLVTVPGNPRSVRQRGFDALGLIARHLVGFRPRRLLVHGGHGEQKNKKIAERKSSVIFYAKDSKGIDILLVDDVRTTDASIKIASLALLLNNARSVRVLTFFLD